LCEDPPDSVVGIATEAATMNDIEYEYNDDADGSVAAATAPAADDVDDDDDENSEDVDDADSGNDGSEAEIHDACVECDKMENTIDDHYGVDFVKGLPSSPEGWIPPGPPEKWTYSAPAGSPLEDEIDNPGKWNLFSFAPKFNASTKKYEGHFTPAGAKVFSAINSAGDREIASWKFYYQGWMTDDFSKATYVHYDAGFGNMKPPSRNGCLDASVLLKHGLDGNRMKDDPLFFINCYSQSTIDESTWGFGGYSGDCGG
jgi:hypothetical protein